MTGAGATGPDAVNGRGRARWLWSGLAVYLAILGSVAAGLIYLHEAARDRLDEALGDRLSAIASTASYLGDGDSLRVWAQATADLGASGAAADGGAATKAGGSAMPAESLDFIWLRRLSRQHKLSLAHTDSDDGLILRASTAELQAFVRRHADDPQAFPEFAVFTRK